MIQNRREFLKATAVTWALASLSRASAPGQTVAAGDDLAWLSLAEASELVRKREVSSLDLTRACLARIERLNPRLNAFITITTERALKDAKAADTEITQARWRGPLHGIPIALKDLVDTAGVRTTAASAIFANRVPREDAEVVRRLRDAGAVMLGKLNMHEFAYGDSSAQSHFGPVRNPWDLERVTGGSSGGSAAAVAAGLCYAALGSDTGGSIRQPAAYCGIVGLKPTYGLVSTRGVVPLSWSLDHVGPMCRRVADAALALQPIAGYDPLETNSLAATPPDYAAALRERVSDLRLGIPRAVFYERLDPEIERAVTDALRVLGRLTRTTGDVQLPQYKMLPIVGAEAYTFHAPYFTKTPERYQPMTRRRLEAGSRVTAAAYIEARRELDRLRRAVVEVFKTVDLLVTPTTPVLPVTVQEALNDPGTPPPGGVAPSLRNTQPFDIYGLPCISVPCGFTRSGLPIGLSISGPHLGEGLVLALAHAYEQATEWHRRRPPV
ncbi:MAG: amidase [Acidobacteria bacterium]|nr:amidase [Acidobacteriota bacterium]